MPDTLLVNTTNTTLEKMWALSSRRSLSRKKKKCIPQIKCNGRRGCISNGPKMESGLELAFEGSTDIECRGGELQVIFSPLFPKSEVHDKQRQQTGTTVCSRQLVAVLNLSGPKFSTQHTFALLAFFKIN